MCCAREHAWNDLQEPGEHGVIISSSGYSMSKKRFRSVQTEEDDHKILIDMY